MARIKTPPGMRERGGNYYWEPSPTLRQTARDKRGELIFKARPLGSDFAAATAEATAINAEVERWRADRNAGAERAAALAERISPRNMTVNDLINAYCGPSGPLRKLAPGSQRRYRQDLDRISDRLGDRLASTVGRRQVQDMIERLSDPEVLEKARTASSTGADGQSVVLDRVIGERLLPEKLPPHAKLRFVLPRRSPQYYGIAAVDGPTVWLAQPCFEPVAPRVEVEVVMQRQRLANGVATMASVLWNWGLREQRISGENPAKNLQQPELKARRRVVSLAELHHLVATADRIDRPEIGDAILMAFMLLQREVDVLAMLVSNLVDGRFRFTQQKTDVYIDTVAPPQLVERLERRRNRDAVHFIVSSTTRRPFTESNFQHRFAEVREAAAVEMPALRTVQFKDLRRSGFVHLARQDTPVAKIVAISGHSLEQGYQMVEVYCPATPDMADDAMRRMRV